MILRRKGVGRTAKDQGRQPADHAAQQQPREEPRKGQVNGGGRKVEAGARRAGGTLQPLWAAALQLAAEQVQHGPGRVGHDPTVHVAMAVFAAAQQAGGKSHKASDGPVEHGPAALTGRAGGPPSARPSPAGGGPLRGIVGWSRRLQRAVGCGRRWLTEEEAARSDEAIGTNRALQTEDAGDVRRKVHQPSCVRRRLAEEQRGWLGCPLSDGCQAPIKSATRQPPRLGHQRGTGEGPTKA